MIDFTDAQQLEKLEQEELRIRRTRRAIEDTYGEKKPTKKRHVLSGRRKWKNKSKQYNELSGALTARSYNIRTEQRRLVASIYKKQKRLQDD